MITPKEAIEKIRLLFKEANLPVEQVEEVAETPAETPVEEAHETSAEETPTEEVALNEQPDYAAQIAALQSRIDTLTSQVAKFNETMQTAVKASEQKFADALNQTLEVVEQIAGEPSAEPAQKPKDTFRAHNKKQGLDRYAQALEKSKSTN